MSGSGAPHVEFSHTIDGKIAIVCAKWHREISEALLSGAQRAVLRSEPGAGKNLHLPGFSQSACGTFCAGGPYCGLADSPVSPRVQPCRIGSRDEKGLAYGRFQYPVG